MTRRILHTLILSIALLAGGSVIYAAPRGWESVKTERTDAKQVAKDSDVEIKTVRGAIIISSNHPVQVKVFTILGQLLSSETLPAGTSQLPIGAHGIYMVKAGDLTCKVAL